MRKTNLSKGQEIKEIAEEMHQITRKMQKILQEEMTQCLETISLHWKGEAADLYLQKAESRRTSMETLLKEIRKTTDYMEEKWEEKR